MADPNETARASRARYSRRAQSKPKRADTTEEANSPSSLLRNLTEIQVVRRGRPRKKPPIVCTVTSASAGPNQGLIPLDQTTISSMGIIPQPSYENVPEHSQAGSSKSWNMKPTKTSSIEHGLHESLKVIPDIDFLFSKEDIEKNINQPAQKYMIFECKDGSINPCEQCSLPRKSKFKITHISNYFHICDEACLNLYLKIMGAKNVFSAAAPTIAKTQITLKYKYCGNYVRSCKRCTREILAEQSHLTWETMDFCTENCLGDYQQENGSICSHCNQQIHHISLGKFSVRFGFNVRHFCTYVCLIEFKRHVKLCMYCQKDISKLGSLRKTMGCNSQFIEFCTRKCVQKYNSINYCATRPPIYRKCSVCAQNKQVKIEYIYLERIHSFCGDPCFVAYKYVNEIDAERCSTCVKFYDDYVLKEHSMYVEDCHQGFCTENCLTIYITNHRRLLSCNWCKLIKYNFDMIERTYKGGRKVKVCSLNCLSLHEQGLNDVILKRTHCDYCNNSEQTLYTLKMSDGVVKHFCAYSCVVAFQRSYALSMGFNDDEFSVGIIQRIDESVAIEERDRCDPETPTIPIITNVESLAVTNAPSTSGTGTNRTGSRSSSSSSTSRECSSRTLSTTKKTSNMKTLPIATASYSTRASRTKVPTTDRAGPTTKILPTTKTPFNTLAPSSTKTPTVQTPTVETPTSQVVPTAQISNVETVSNLEIHSAAEIIPIFRTTTKSNTETLQKEVLLPPLPPPTPPPPPPPKIETLIKYQFIIKTLPPPPQRNVNTMCKIPTSDNEATCIPEKVSLHIQTDDIEEIPSFVPVPIPLYVPAPEWMYSAPNPIPFPFPFPLPVPIFIPTTKMAAKGIMKEIETAQLKTPADPLEAELLMMAEMVAADKKDSGSESEDENNADDALSPARVKTHNSLEKSVTPAVDLEGALTVNTITACSEENEENIDMAQVPTEVQMQVRKRSPRRLSKRVRRASGHKSAASIPENSPQPSVPAQKPDAKMCLKYTFGVNAWKQWVALKNTEMEKSSHRPKLFKTDILQLTSDELNYSLCLFVKEVHKPNGQEYAPDTIYYLCLGIQQFLLVNSRIDNIFSDPYYERFTDCFDEVARKFSVLYSDSHYIVTRVEEEHLWESKQLGAHSPHVLLTTLMFFNTKYFYLGTVEEHMQLSFSHIMKHWKRNSGSKLTGSRNVLLRFYPPHASSTDLGNRKKKVYEQQENEANPLKCPVKLYEFYLSKCPESVKTRSDVFYLLPERSCVPDSPVWYSTSASPQYALEKMLHRVKMVKEVNVSLLSI